MSRARHSRGLAFCSRSSPMASRSAERLVEVAGSRKLFFCWAGLARSRRDNRLAVPTGLA